MIMTAAWCHASSCGGRFVPGLSSVPMQANGISRALSGRLCFLLGRTGGPPAAAGLSYDICLIAGCARDWENWICCPKPVQWPAGAPDWFRTVGCLAPVPTA